MSSEFDSDARYSEDDSDGERATPAAVPRTVVRYSLSQARATQDDDIFDDKPPREVPDSGLSCSDEDDSVDPIRLNPFAELLPKLLQKEMPQGELKEYDRASLVHRRDVRYVIIKTFSEALALPNLTSEKQTRIIIWLLLLFISIANRESEVSQYIENVLRQYFSKEGQDFNGVLRGISNDFCKTQLQIKGKAPFSVGSIMAQPERNMRCVLELFRELDRQVKSFFDTPEVNAQMETTVTLAQRIFSTLNITKDTLFERIEPKTISAEANEILRHYFPQFVLEEKKSFVLQ